MALKLSADSDFLNSPSWLLVHKKIHVALSYKLIDELFTWVIVIVFITSFVYLLDFSRWFFMDHSHGVKRILFNIWETIKAVPRRILPKPRTWSKYIHELSFRQITVYALLIAAVAALSLPADSSEIFNHIARGAMQSNYDANPYVDLVNEIPAWRSDQLLANLDWQSKLAQHGPLLMIIAKLLMHLSWGNLWIALLLFKLMNLLVFAILLDCLCRILSDEELSEDLFGPNAIFNLEKPSSASSSYYGLFTSPEAQLAFKKVIYSLIALNPFIMVQCIWNGHSELLLGLGVVLSVYCAYKRRYNWSILALTLATLIQFSCALLFPLILIMFWRDLDKHLPIPGLLLSTMIAALLLSYYKILTFDYMEILHSAMLSHKSLFDVLNSLNHYLGGGDLSYTLRYVFVALFMLLLFALYYRFSKSSRAEIYRYAFLVLFIMICFASPRFYAWYLVVLLPLGVLVHPRLVLLLSCSHLLSITLIDQANIINFLVMMGLPCYYYFRLQRHQDAR